MLSTGAGGGTVADIARPGMTPSSGAGGGTVVDIVRIGMTSSSGAGGIWDDGVFIADITCVL